MHFIRIKLKRQLIFRDDERFELEKFRLHPIAKLLLLRTLFEFVHLSLNEFDCNVIPIDDMAVKLNLVDDKEHNTCKININAHVEYLFMLFSPIY